MSGLTQSKRIAKRAKDKLRRQTKGINQLKEEFGVTTYDHRYSKSQLYKLPDLSKAIVDKQITDMESEGYVFERTESNIAYSIQLSEILDIYKRRNILTYREEYSGSNPFVMTVANLKGGATKTVSSVTLTHALRTHPHLLRKDLRILLIDLDPQGSASMFLDNSSAITTSAYTACQAMLQNVSKEDLLENYVQSSPVSGVDIIPANIGDAFIAAQWDSLCAEHLPEQNPKKVLQENIINKLKGEYDFILIDNGPHLDAFLENTLFAVDMLLTPIPPSTVDFHSTLRYLERLPELYESLKAAGAEPRFTKNVGFMTKLADKPDHHEVRSVAKDIFGGDMLDESMLRIDSYERCGETFDTVISATSKHYEGSVQTLKRAQENAYAFAKSVFDKITNVREDSYE